MFGGLVIMWQGNFLLWSNLFGVLHASFIFTGITLFRLRKFYTMIFWKHVLGFWAAFFLLILYLYSSFIALTFLWLMHSFLLSYMQCLRFSFLSLIFYWWSWPLWFLLDFLLFFISRIPEVCVLFIAFISIFKPWTFLKIPLFVFSLIF